MGWDACYVRLLYKSILELWLDDNISSLTCRVFAHLADHREWEAELTKGFHRDRSRYKKNKPWQKKRKWQMTNVPNAALASDSLEEVWTCRMWAMMLDLEAFIPGMLRAKRASSAAGDVFSRFPTWNPAGMPLSIYSSAFRSFRSVRKAAPVWACKKVERRIACHMSDCKEKSADSSPLLPWEFKVNFIAISWRVQLVLLIRFASNILNHHPFHWHSKMYTTGFRFGVPRMLPRQTCSAWIISRCKWGTVMWPMVASLLNCRLISLCCCKLRTHVG